MSDTIDPFASKLGTLTNRFRDLELYFRKYAQVGDDVLVIGIDFGTTYSGVAWATLPDFQANRVNIISRWLGGPGERGKTPTQIYYENGKVSWGYNVPSDADPLRWFKLLLVKFEDMDPRLQRSQYILRARDMLADLNKTPVEVVADYLKAIWEHALECITKARGASVVDGMQFHVVITIPAIWKSYAKQAMTDAARMAGILPARGQPDRDAGATTLIFAPEPEAAALATFADRGLHPFLKVGESHIICDAGGGTVDLITYGVQSVTPTKMTEAVAGTGALCGGIFIDQEFERSCKVRLGRRWGKISQRDVKNFMEREWEFGLKPQFHVKSGSPDVWPLTVPPSAFDSKSEKNDASREPVLRDGTLFYQKALVRTLFDSQINETRQLVRSQLKAAEDKGQNVKGIILVGGLGSSPYLYDVLQEEHGSSGINVIQADGERPWTAICRGAVYKGFLNNSSIPMPGPQPVEIVSKVARMHLGYQSNQPFDEKMHAKDTKEWDADEKRWFSMNQMTWLIRKGENVATKSEGRGELYRTFDESSFHRSNGTFTTYLWQSENDEAPKTYTEYSVQQLCTITFKTKKKWRDLPDLLDANGAKVKGKKMVEYCLVMIPSGSSVDFAVVIDGERQGSQSVNVEFARGE